MDIKDRMLIYIINNVNWFMTASNMEVISYSELSESTFLRAQAYFAKEAEFDDVVCLISTSVLEPGKSGVLFTTNSVYCKAWGGVFTSACVNSLYDPDGARFDIINEFDEERMRELMFDLLKMSLEDTVRGLEAVQESIRQLQDAVRISSQREALRKMGSFKTSTVAVSRKAIEKAIERSLEGDDEDVEALGLELYMDVSDASEDFIELIYACADKGIDNEITEEVIDILNDLLIGLYNHMLGVIESDLEDSEKFLLYYSDTFFWAVLFSDADLFRESFSQDELKSLPDLWDYIIELTDCFLEVENWKPKFADIIEDSSNKILDYFNILMDTTVEEIDDEMEKLIDNTYEERKQILDALDRATDYLSSLIED